MISLNNVISKKTKSVFGQLYLIKLKTKWYVSRHKFSENLKIK